MVYQTAWVDPHHQHEITPLISSIAIHYLFLALTRAKPGPVPNWPGFFAMGESVNRDADH